MLTCKEGVADRGGRTQVARVLLRPRLPSRACQRDAAMGAGWMDARCGESRWMGRWGDAARRGCCGCLPPSSARAWDCGGGTRKRKEMSDLGVARWWKGAGAGGCAVAKRATGRAITRSNMNAQWELRGRPHQLFRPRNKLVFLSVSLLAWPIYASCVCESLVKPNAP